jgi:DNA helicase HerA-like ATPase
LDEANRFCPAKPAPLPPQIADFNDQCRHYGIAGGYVARRPSQLNQDLTELADYLFIFRLTGKNDLKYLSDLVSGLDDAVRSLRDHEFVKVNPDKSYVICEPVKPPKIWLDRASKLLGKNT